MMTSHASIQINKPVAEVWKFVGADYVQNHPKFDPRCKSTELTPPGPLAKGSKGREVRREGTYTFEVTEFEPDKRLAFKTTSGPSDFVGSFSVAPANGGTALTIDFQVQFRGFMRLMAPMIGGSLRKETASTAERIKKLLEG